MAVVCRSFGASADSVARVGPKHTAGDVTRRISDGLHRHDNDATEVSVRHAWDSLSGTGRPGDGAVICQVGRTILLLTGSIHGSHVRVRLVSSGSLPITARSCGRTDLASPPNNAGGPP